VASTYTLTAADAGHTVRVEVSAHNATGTSAPTPSATTATVVPQPAASVAPSISGVAAVHKQLSTTNGTWNSADAFAYAWLRCAADGSNCAVIQGATAATYLAVSADAGHTVEARVTATNIAGTAAAVSAHSSLIVDVPTATKAPHISGRARVGKKLSAKKGSWTFSPTHYRYQWMRCNAHGSSCSTIHHATRSKYTLTRHDAGHRLRLRVTATNAAGSTSVTSAPSRRVGH
jgi:hypothetical protein